MQRRYAHILIVILLTIATLSCGPGVQAPEQQQDAQARALLDSVLKRYRVLRSYRAQIEIQHSDRAQKPQNIMFAFEQPNKVAFINMHPVAGAQIVSDGEHLYCYLPILKEYTKIPLPPLFMFEPGSQNNLLSRISCTVPTLVMLENPEAYLMHNVKSVELAPPDSIGPHLCEVLHLTQNNDAVTQLWVDKRANIIRKCTTDMTPYFQAIAKQRGLTPPSSPMTISEWHTNIQLNEPIPPDTFAFTPPEGVQEVTSLSLAPQPASSPLVLTGQTAPAFTLEDLEGNIHNLPSLNGKITILSFWTSQNPQSVSTLLLLQKLHERYAASGLVVLGMTNEANVEVVKRFLKERGISFPVLRDLKEAVASQYDVRVVPRLIIIDQSGKVHTDLNRMPSEEELVSALEELGIQ
jgi:outer membrane lipoprotein-sorting protein/peroxiredoxin